MKIHISCQGEPDVGINGCNTTIDLCTDIEDDSDREYVRKLVIELFRELWDESIIAIFDDECSDCGCQLKGKEHCKCYIPDEIENDV